MNSIVSLKPYFSNRKRTATSYNSCNNYDYEIYNFIFDFFFFFLNNEEFLIYLRNALLFFTVHLVLLILKNGEKRVSFFFFYFINPFFNISRQTS